MEMDGGDLLVVAVGKKGSKPCDFKSLDDRINKIPEDTLRRMPWGSPEIRVDREHGRERIRGRRETLGRVSGSQYVGKTNDLIVSAEIGTGDFEQESLKKAILNGGIDSVSLGYEAFISGAESRYRPVEVTFTSDPAMKPFQGYDTKILCAIKRDEYLSLKEAGDVERTISLISGNEGVHYKSRSLAEHSRGMDATTPDKPQEEKEQGTKRPREEDPKYDTKKIAAAAVGLMEELKTKEEELKSMEKRLKKSEENEKKLNETYAKKISAASEAFKEQLEIMKKNSSEDDLATKKLDYSVIDTLGLHAKKIGDHVLNGLIADAFAVTVEHSRAAYEAGVRKTLSDSHRAWGISGGQIPIPSPEESRRILSAATGKDIPPPQDSRGGGTRKTIEKDALDRGIDDLFKRAGVDINSKISF